ncbi:DnaJ-domain-containing protein [Lizonia empirigonia]|nr:DnaJ-domain-containing protein [Lizonia empirigonia]
MSEFIEDFFLSLACNTPLPSSSVAGRRAEKSCATKPYTRAQAKFEQQAELLPNASLQSSRSGKKRGRKSEFHIFTDADTTHVAHLPCPKKLKPHARVPLSIRTDLANDTPLPTPRQPDRPFPFSRSDPLWANVENYDPWPPPFSSPRPSTRAGWRRRVSSANLLPPPKDKTLYLALHLDDWKVTEDQIKNAYRKVAIEYHPDKVAEEERKTATQMMQNVNAAKEVLLDNKRRRAYHVDGKLPWTT